MKPSMVRPCDPALERLRQNDLNLGASLGNRKREGEGGKGGGKDRGIDGLGRGEGRRKDRKRQKRGAVVTPQWIKHLPHQHELQIQTSSIT